MKILVEWWENEDEYEFEIFELKDINEAVIKYKSLNFSNADIRFVTDVGELQSSFKKDSKEG